MEGDAPGHAIRPYPAGVVGAQEADGGHPQGQAHVQGAAVVGHQEAALCEQRGHGEQGKAAAGHQGGAGELGRDGLGVGRSPAPLIIRSGVW